jgi:hypothetical protein
LWPLIHRLWCIIPCIGKKSRTNRFHMDTDCICLSPGRFHQRSVPATIPHKPMNNEGW